MPPKTKKNAAKNKKLQPAKAKKLKAMPKSPKKKEKLGTSGRKDKITVSKPKKRSNVSVELKKYKAYKEIAENKYASKAQRAAVAAACNIGADSSINICNCTKKCDANCQNRQLYIECSPGECPSLRSRQTHCDNTVIQRRAFPQTEVYLSDGCGHGLRLPQPVSAGRVLIEYTGQVITDEECTARRNKLKHNEDFYFASLCVGFVLDAKPMGSKARFANHSCRPNCEMQKWVASGEPRLVLVALSDLPAGAALTYNYNCHDDGLGVEIRRQACRCGASNCAGTIGGRVAVSEEDRWELKAASMLSPERQCHISAYRSHLQAAANQASPLYLRLAAAVVQVDGWVRDEYRPLFPEGVEGGLWELQPPERIAVILESFPISNVRCDEYSHLSGIYKAAGKVGRRVEQCIGGPAWAGPPAGDGAGSAEGSASMEVDADAGAAVEAGAAQFAESVQWGALVGLLREAAAVLPVPCAAPALLRRALHLCEEASRWAQAALLRLSGSPPAAEEWRAPKSSAWAAISRLGRYYGVPVTPYAFMAEKFLDLRLSTYIKRAQLLLEPEAMATQDGSLRVSILSSTPFQDIDLGVDPELPVAFDRPEAAAEVPPGEDDFTLHCVCRLPETEGESQSLVQCAECGGWLHPLCVNRRELLGGGAGRALFVCPLCQHLGGAVSALADPGSQEYFDRSLFPKVRPSYSLTGAYREPPPGGLDALRPADCLVPEAGMAFGLTALPALVLRPLCGLFSSLTGDQCSAGQAAALGAVDGARVSSRADILRARAGPAGRSRAPMGLAEVRSCIAEGEALALKTSAPVLLLKLVGNYAHKWCTAVDAFFAENGRLIAALEVSLAAASVASLHARRVDAEALENEARVIARAQFLYSCVRLLAVAPRRELIRLRMLIWVLSAGTLLRRSPVEQEGHCADAAVSSDAGLSDDIGLYIMESQRRNSAHLINLDDLMKCEAYGRSIIQAAVSLADANPNEDFQAGGFGSLGRAAWRLLSLLNALVHECFSAFQAARRCPADDGSARVAALRRLQPLAAVVEMRQVYAVARVLSLDLRAGCMSRGGPMDVASDQPPSADTSADQEARESSAADGPAARHCWCRGGEWGAMICCDGCDNWFHSRCVGLERRARLKSLDSYLCIACAENGRSEYVYEWSSKVS